MVTVSLGTGCCPLSPEHTEATKYAPVEDAKGCGGVATVLIYLSAVLVAGLGALLLRLPPLVGFLAAGFLLNGLGIEKVVGLDAIAEMGVTLMLFAIGLKFDVRALLGKEVCLTASAHMAATVVVGTGFLSLLTLTGLLSVGGAGTVVVLALALSFSSTVFAIKILQDRGDEQTFYGRVTIGILIMQDIVAVAFMSISRGTLPSPLTFGLVVLLPVMWMVVKRLPRLSHGEMAALFGIFMALVPGFGLFEYLGLSGSLGALVMGMVLASHPGADQLSHSLFTLKELLLVGFFVNIGFTGLPDVRDLELGLLLLLLLPVQGAGYWVLLWAQGLRHRTSLLASLLLSTYSEFGLIVAGAGVSAGWLEAKWMVTIAIAVAGSFVVAAIINPRNTSVLSDFASRFPPRPPGKLHIHDRPIPFGDARALVLGMGRLGIATYEHLADEYGMDVLGVEHDPRRVAILRPTNVNVIEGDATDTDFWDRVIRNGLIEVIVLAMPSQHANIDALREIKQRKFTGTVAAVAMYHEDVDELHERGIDVAVHMYEGAGRDLADRSIEARRQHD